MSNNSTPFLVYCMKYNDHPADGGEPALEMEIVGIFPTFEDAMMARDVYADLDTTMEAVDIVSAALFDEVPDYDVMLKIAVSRDGQTITVDSVCVTMDAEPWLRQTHDHCEALTVPEDREYMIEHMTQWAQQNLGVTPVVEDNISPSARELLEN